MITLKLRVPNSSTATHRMVTGFLALAVLAVAAVGLSMAVAHWAFLVQHPWWGVAGVVFLLICAGYVLIFADESLLQEKGRLLLTDESICIDNDGFLLGFVRKIAVVVGGQKSQAAGTANRIILYTVNRQKVACDFVFNSHEEQRLLQQLLLHWKMRGIKLVVKGLPVD